MLRHKIAKNVGSIGADATTFFSRRLRTVRNRFTLTSVIFHLNWQFAQVWLIVRNELLMRTIRPRTKATKACHGVVFLIFLKLKNLSRSWTHACS